MKTICLYYSRSNLTRSIARRLSELLGADLFEYTDGVNRRGVLGYLRSCVDSFRKPPAVYVIGNEPDWEKYDRVIVAMPVWAEKPCVVGQAFLQQFSAKFRGDLYLVVTHMAENDYEKAIRKVYRCCVKEPAGHLSLQTKDHDPGAEIEEFVRKIQGQQGD